MRRSGGLRHFLLTVYRALGEPSSFFAGGQAARWGANQFGGMSGASAFGISYYLQSCSKDIGALGRVSMARRQVHQNWYPGSNDMNH